MEREIGDPVTGNMYYLIIRVPVSHEDTKMHLVPVNSKGEGHGKIKISEIVAQL